VIESFAWWRRKDPDLVKGGGAIVYEGIERGLGRIAEAIRERGPFDGVVGFSQGACAAGMVTSLLEGSRRKDWEATRARSAEDRKQRLAFPASFEGEGGGAEAVQGPLRFAVIYSGFCAPGEMYEPFYEPEITTPTLHVLGSLDTIVSEERSRTLVERCRDAHVLVHPGGHFCPSTRDHLDRVVGFIRAAVMGEAGEMGHEKGRKEERAEDMEMPF